MPDAVAKGITYNGCFRHKLDDKRRLPIPAKWRPEDSDAVEYTLIVWPKHQAGICLRVLPPDQLAKMLASIDAMPNSDPNKSVLKRSIGSFSAQAKLDAAGRITLPDSMAEKADIGHDAVLVGMLDRFEIWSPKRYAQVQVLDEAHFARAYEMME